MHWLLFQCNNSQQKRWGHICLKIWPRFAQVIGENLDRESAKAGRGKRPDDQDQIKQMMKSKQQWYTWAVLHPGQQWCTGQQQWLGHWCHARSSNGCCFSPPTHTNWCLGLVPVHSWSGDHSYTNSRQIRKTSKTNMQDIYQEFCHQDSIQWKSRVWAATRGHLRLNLYVLSCLWLNLNHYIKNEY